MLGVLALFILTVIPAVQAATYSDDFDDGILGADWSQSSGSWSESGGVLIQDSGGGGTILNDNAAGGAYNYTVSTDVMLDGDDSYYNSLLLRSDSAGYDAVEVRLAYGSDKIVVGYLSGGSWNAIRGTSYNGGYLDSNTWHSVNASIEGNTVTVSVDGSSELQVTSSALDTGGSHIGLKGTENNGGYHGDSDDRNLFDNFQVSSSQSGPSSLSLSGTIIDSTGSPLTADISLLDGSDAILNSTTGTSFSFTSTGGETLRVYADSEGVESRFSVSSNSSGAEITLDGHQNNPESASPPGIPVRYATVDAQNLSHSGATVRIHYDQSSLGTVTEGSLTLRKYDNGTWTTLPTTVNSTNDYAEANVSSLSSFALTGSTDPGNPSISADPESIQISPGYTANYTLTVKNWDDSADTLTLSTSTTNSSWTTSLSQYTVTLDPDESKNVYLYVGVPSGTTYGTSSDVTVTVTSGRNATQETYLQTNASVLMNGTLEGTEVTGSGTASVRLLRSSDDFDDGTISPDWVVQNGSWYESSNVLRQDSGGVGSIAHVNATGDPDALTGIQDYNVSVDMQMRNDDQHHTSLLMRSDGERNGIEIRLDYSNDQVHVGYVEEGQFNPVQTVSKTLYADTWYELNASVEGTTVTASMDGQHLITAANDNFTFAYTHVALKGKDDNGQNWDDDGDENWFDNFEFWTESGTYTSPTLDAELNDPDYSALTINATVPSGTALNATVTASTDDTFGNGDDTSQTFQIIDGENTYSSDWIDGYRYLRLRANLSGTSGATPELHSWSVTRQGGTPQDNVTVTTTAEEPSSGFSLNIDPDEDDVPLGSYTNFTVTITNNGTTSDTVTLSTTETGDTDFFSSTLSRDRVSLNPGKSENVTLTMTAAAGTPFDSNLTTTVTATSTTNNSRTADAQATGHVRSPYPNKLRLATNRYVVLDDPDRPDNPSPDFNDVPSGNEWDGGDYWKNESTTIRAYALVTDQYGEPLPNQTVRFVVKDWSGDERLNTTSSTNRAGLASTHYDLNEKRDWGFWKIDAYAEHSVDTPQDDARFIYNWFGCANCHDDSGWRYGSPDSVNNPDYSRSPYVMGYEAAGHVEGRWRYCMPGATADGRCTYCHQGYGGDDPAGDHSTGGQYPWGAMRGDVKCPDCHTPDGDPSWLANGGADGKGLPRMPSCFESRCHNLVNPNVQPWRTTTVELNQSQYSHVWAPNTTREQGEPLKAHSVYEDGGDVPCVMCHGPMHNTTTPHPDGMGNEVTENEHCYECHVEVKHPFFKGVPTPQPCTDCHTQNLHNVSGSLRHFPRTEPAKYDQDRNIQYVDDPAWGLWQRWELAYNETYDASQDPYRKESIDKDTCEACHAGENQKRGLHRIDLEFVADDSSTHSYFEWGGKGLNCLGCHDSKLDGSGTGQEIHSAHPASYDGSRSRCSTCHPDGDRKDSGKHEVPKGTSSGTYGITVFGVNVTYDASETQTCDQCHDDWHRDPEFDGDRYPTLSQGLDETLRPSSSTNVSSTDYRGPRTNIDSTVSPGVENKSGCTTEPCHLQTAHEAMKPAATGSRFPEYSPGAAPGCDACHSLNEWGSHMETLTDLYTNYGGPDVRSSCDTCHFEAKRDEGYISNIYRPFHDGYGSPNSDGGGGGHDGWGGDGGW